MPGQPLPGSDLGGYNHTGGGDIGVLRGFGVCGVDGLLFGAADVLKRKAVGDDSDQNFKNEIAGYQMGKIAMGCGVRLTEAQARVLFRLDYLGWEQLHSVKTAGGCNVRPFDALVRMDLIDRIDWRTEYDQRGEMCLAYYGINRAGVRVLYGMKHFARYYELFMRGWAERRRG